MHLQPIISLSCLLLTLLLSGCSDGSDSNGNATTFDDCNLPAQDIVVNATASGIEFVRTPDTCFEALDAYDFAPNYVTVDGLRMHYVDAGPADGEVILMLHGQPSWSYLYREMIPVLVEAGRRNASKASSSGLIMPPARPTCLPRMWFRSERSPS